MKNNFVYKIYRGCGYLEGYGYHPGTGIIGVIFIGSLMALYNADLIGWAFVISPFLVAYFYGAHERYCDFEKNQK